jgi:hypothetical protein
MGSPSGRCAAAALARAAPEPRASPTVIHPTRALAHAPLGMERDLAIGVITGRADLNHERGRAHKRAAAAPPVQAGVRDPVAVFVAEVHPTGHRLEARRARERIQQHGQLLRQPLMLIARRWIHHVGAVPHLVVAILTQLPAALKQRLELFGRGIAHERRHAPKPNGRLIASHRSGHAAPG